MKNWAVVVEVATLLVGPNSGEFGYYYFIVYNNLNSKYHHYLVTKLN